MKNPYRALAFSAALLALAGCPKKGVEPSDRVDASLAPSTTSAEVTVPQAVEDAGAPQAAATGEDDGGTTFERSDALPAADAGSRGAAAGVKHAAQSAARADAGSAADAGSVKGASAPASREACVDRWLTSQGLDRYGSKQGTMYAGGSPLFDERTGETKDRLAYIFERHPAAQQACPQ